MKWIDLPDGNRISEDGMRLEVNPAFWEALAKLDPLDLSHFCEDRLMIDPYVTMKFDHPFGWIEQQLAWDDIPKRLKKPFKDLVKLAKAKQPNIQIKHLPDGTVAAARKEIEEDFVCFWLYNKAYGDHLRSGKGPEAIGTFEGKTRDFFGQVKI
jgi:hypothetical protein